MEAFGSSASQSMVKLDSPQAAEQKSSFAAAKLMNLVETARVGDGFFETAKIPLLAGKTFREESRPETTHLTVVNETLATGLYKGKNPIGEVLELDGQRLEIIGVVKDVRSGFLFNIAQKRAYLPLDADSLRKPGPRGVALMVRVDPGVAADVVVRQAVSSLDPNLTVFDISSMDQRITEMLSAVRLTLSTYGAIGLFCLSLAVIGLGGVTAYAVTQRRREIGIRMALGAERPDILRLVMKEGTVLVLAGTLVGAACSYGMLRVLSRILDVLAQITSTSISDPRLLIGAPVLLASLAMLACYLPARRSMRIDPVAALRED